MVKRFTQGARFDLVKVSQQTGWIRASPAGHGLGIQGLREYRYYINLSKNFCKLAIMLCIRRPKNGSGSTVQGHPTIVHQSPPLTYPLPTMPPLAKPLPNCFVVVVGPAVDGAALSEMMLIPSVKRTDSPKMAQCKPC